MVLFDARSQKWLQAQPLRVTEVNVNSKVTSVAFSPDGKTLAAGFYYPDRVGGVVLFDATNRQRLQAQPLPVAEGSVTSIAFSPDGKTLAAGYSSPNGDGGVVLFDATSQKRLHAQPLPVAEVDTTSVAFSPDGKILAAGYKARSVLTCGVVLFDAKTPQQHQARRLPVTEGGVESVAFSPEGKTLLAVGYIGGVVLFDATTRQRLVAQPFEVPGFVWSVAFSRDGKTLAAGGGGVMLLDVDPISWRRKAAHVANRNFTRVEWTLYFPDTPYRRTIRSLPWPRDLPEAERKQAEAFEKEHPEGSDAS